MTTLTYDILWRMKQFCEAAENFTANWRHKSEEKMKIYGISGRELALNLGRGDIFEGLAVDSASRKELLSNCYVAFVEYYQDLDVFKPGCLNLRHQCLELINTFHYQQLKNGYTPPDLSTVNMEEKLNVLMNIFVSKDPLFVQMFHGNPPKSLVTAARDYELSAELRTSLNDLLDFLSNNHE